VEWNRSVFNQLHDAYNVIHKIKFIESYLSSIMQPSNLSPNGPDNEVELEWEYEYASDEEEVISPAT
jgi:hypothetical protein